MRFQLLAAVVMLLCNLPLPIFAASGQELAISQCANCHALEEPRHDQMPAGERAARKAPPLFYAGNKFRREWLTGWLQNPERIRPAGYFPPDHVIEGQEGDLVDEDSLPKHPRLSRQQAEQVTDHLMTLNHFASRIADVDYQPGSIAWKMGNLNFGKFNGCDACHRDAPNHGGVSGPELYTVFDRLQPAFIFSYISNPVAWDTHTLMPYKALNPDVIKKLVDYLKVNGEDQE